MHAHHHNQGKTKQMDRVDQIIYEGQLFFNFLHSREQFVVPVPFIGVHSSVENAETALLNYVYLN